MSNVWCVRAEFGTYAKHFVAGGCVAIGWMPNTDLSATTTREEIYPLYKAEHPDDTSNIVIGQQVGQIARFLLEMEAGDYVITPAADTELLHHGRLAPDPSYVYSSGDDGCPYRHRRRVEWASETLKRSGFSVPFQNTIRSSLTVFAVSQRDEFLAAVGRKDLMSAPQVATYDPYLAVLEQVLQLDDKEFEILVGHLLTALGFEGSEVTGKSGDGGVDATGELNVANLAKVKVFVQAKRYQLGVKVAANVVRQLRQAIPFGGQGAFITTAGYQSAAADVALEPGFPRIGLINGRQLVDLLVEHWSNIPQEFQERLGLKPGLVRV
ncbi:MAG TPA: restriction endonuclease [Blastocatellia bacterium]|nr:restriction endonuclease [Blastocatellia bacterium]